MSDTTDFPRSALKQVMKHEVEFAEAHLVTNPDGSQVWQFDMPKQIWAYLRPPEDPAINDYSVDSAGQKVQIEVLMDVLTASERSRGEKITYELIQVNDRIMTPHGAYKIVDKSFVELDDIDRFALTRDLRNGPVYGGTSPSDGIKVTLPETFEYPAGVQWYDVYTGDVPKNSENFHTDGIAIQGETELIIPIEGRTIYEPQTPNLTSKGNYYSFEFNTPKPLFGNNVAESRFYFGMQDGSGINSESYFLELPYGGSPELFYRDELGDITSITDTSSGLIEDEIPHVPVIKWDDGTLGGNDGDIGVNVYNRYTDKKVASASGRSTAIKSGTIGWGTSPSATGGFADYLRNAKYEPIQRQGAVLESFESGTLNDYTNFANVSGNYTVKKDYRATDGEYLLKLGPAFSFLYNDTKPSGTSKGHFYSFNLWQKDTDSGRNSQLNYFYFGMPGGGPVTNTNLFRTQVEPGSDKFIDIDFREGKPESGESQYRGGWSNEKELSAIPTNEWVTLQLWWDDGTLGGSDGDIGLEVFRKFDGERRAYAFGNTSNIMNAETIPTSGYFGWASNGEQDNNPEPALIDNLREATKPTFTSPDTPPGK